MGDITDRFSEVYRDSFLRGVPASGANEPEKAAIRSLGKLIDDRVSAAVAGLKYYPTLVALNADATKPVGTLAYVYGEEAFYHYEVGGWQEDAGFGTAVFNALSTETGTKNLFDEGAVTAGYEVQYSGAILAEPNSVASAPMYVGNMQTLSVSGLGNNPDFDRVYAFYSALPADATTFISYAQITGNSRERIVVPDGAQYFRLSPKQRQAGAVSLAAVQVEAGDEATAYEEFTPRIATLNGMRLGDSAPPPLIYSVVYGGARNLFDVDAALVGYEVQYSGGVYLEPNSVVSDAIFVGDLENVTFSGMAANPFINRVYAFYETLEAANHFQEGAGAGFISYGQILPGAAVTIPVPANAKYMRFSPKQRQEDGGSYANTQAEPGTIASPFAPYEQVVVQANGRNIGRESQDGGGGSVGALALFGDSITQTENVDAGQYVYGSNFMPNWPDYAIPGLDPASAYNFAKAGAAFCNYGGSTPTQRFEVQVTNALAQGFTATCVVVALGINDLRFVPGNLGDFDVAMGKAINALDLTVPIEAARAGFYRLQQAWPNAVKFVSLPMQTAQSTYASIESWNSLIARMARRYGFTVIDSFNESGIVRDFENPAGAGQDLYDGLHPGASGQRKQGVLIAARVKSRMGL